MLTLVSVEALDLELKDRPNLSQLDEVKASFLKLQ